jgi:hypothetical protein
MKIKSPVEANSGRVTNQGEEPSEARQRLNFHLNSRRNARRNLRADEQKSDPAVAKRRQPAAGCPAGVERSGSNRPRARRRNLIKLGVNPSEVHKASRSRKGYWRMSQN